MESKALAQQWWRRQRGDAAEQRASEWLRAKGLTLVAQNWQCRLGEIDLIMQHDDMLVFIEVRYREQEHFGGALASVDCHKQRRLIAAARYYLAKHPRWANSCCRFDVIAFSGATSTPTWIENAFYGDE